MRKQGLILIIALFGVVAAIAQPSNDECTNPIVIPSVLNFCSANAAYTNVGATPSTYGPATCFGATQNDVWFAFTAQATDVTITVRGATPQAPGGTLQNPQVALYFGNCGGTINQLECQTTFGSTDIVEGYQGGLFVGSTYLIRIQGAAGKVGTFQLCINNYNPPVEPTSDCPDASILCDKSSFVVQNVTGAGNNISELTDALCFSNGAPGNFETNSTWFVWTCSQSGTLEFTLTPLNVSDDLDFALYRLPNGIGNCTGKQLVRCMASGDNSFPSPCMGPTGLQSGDPDVSEDAGCQQAGDDAWLSPFSMIQGESYALCVNNFTSTGNGFLIDFGGTGLFLGPEAAFTTDPPAVCLGTAVSVLDASTFALGAITAWKWSFGADAVPQTATGPGPHTVQFNTPGLRPVVLTLETALGCKITDIQTVNIFPDVEVDTLIAAPDCNGTANGTVTINNITSGTPPYLYSWNGGPFGNTPSLSGLGVGTYTLVIRDSNNCETDLSIDVKERVLTAEAVVDKPLCFGDDNGVITMNVTNGVQPIQFDFGNGFINQNFQGGFAAGSYTIQAIDEVLCKGTFEVAVTDNPVLELALDTIDISCFSANDGMGLAIPSGGVGNYSYLWTDGQTTNKANDLPPGTFGVTVTDGNGCTVSGSIFVVEPADVAIALVDVQDLLCNGQPTGEVRVEGLGGRMPYTFSADGVNFVPSDTLRNLPAGDYWIKIKDNGGCIDSVFATIIEPPPLVVAAEPADTTLDLGFTVLVTTVTSPAGRPVTYAWSPPMGLDNANIAEPTITAISNQIYTITITDEDGCTAVDDVQILVNKNRPMYFPNVFGPEKQFPNNFFTGFGGPAAEAITLMRVYDRWGTLIYETRSNPINDPARGWDGTYKGEPVQGVFTFYAFVKFIDGEELQYEGDITVVR
ncbi:MAG: gliding motility-associated C-terminal domain-containing protein [Saprospiraceae bacterium]|nr:gliding motility-associated C-terminal domain-containing protein [Saprospiraceae bacterium]